MAEANELTSEILKKYIGKTIKDIEWEGTWGETISIQFEDNTVLTIEAVGSENTYAKVYEGVPQLFVGNIK